MKKHDVALAICIVFLVFFAWSARADAQPADAPKTLATCAGLAPTHYGTAGDDVIHGTPGDDVIRAGAGNDIIYGRGGDDTICAGTGNDMIDGGIGTDRVLSGEWCSRAAIAPGCSPPGLPGPPPAPCGGVAPAFVYDAVLPAFEGTGVGCHMANVIAYRESRWQCSAVSPRNSNGSRDYGLLQLTSTYHQAWMNDSGLHGDVLDCGFNARLARHVYDEALRMWGNGLAPWGG